MAARVRRCERCNRRLRGAANEWVVEMGNYDPDGYGEVLSVICPDCATGEEHLEREIANSTTDYHWRGERVARYPKSGFPEAAMN